MGYNHVFSRTMFVYLHSIFFFQIYSINNKNGRTAIKRRIPDPEDNDRTKKKPIQLSDESSPATTTTTTNSFRTFRETRAESGQRVFTEVNTYEGNNTLPLTWFTMLKI